MKISNGERRKRTVFEGRLLVFTFLVVLFIFLVAMGIGGLIAVGGIVLTGDGNYNSTLSAVVQEPGFTHLEVSNDGYYEFLIGYWNFDHDNSTGTTEFSANNRDGTFVNGLTSNASCLYDNCPMFDGVNDFINVSDDNGAFNFSATENFSVTFWVNAGTATTPRFIAKSLNTNSTWEIFSPAANGLRWNTRNFTGAAQAVSITNALPVNTWVHIAATRAGGNKTLYINGVANASANTGFGDFGIGNDPLIIGASATQSTLFMNGSLDEIMIFNTTLQDFEVLEIYNNASSRYTRSGEQVFSNIDFGNNGSVNVSLADEETNLGSFFTLQINEGESVDFINGEINNYNLTGNFTNATVTIAHTAGDDQFYAPLLAGNITLTNFSGATIVLGSNTGGTQTAPPESPSRIPEQTQAPEYWTATFIDNQLTLDPSLTRNYLPRQRSQVRINEEVIYVGVASITGSEATIEVSSTGAQQADLMVGESVKFETNGDGYYDIEVTLDSIMAGRAQVTVDYIYEEVQSTEEAPVESEEETLLEDLQDTASGRPILIGIIAFIGVLILVLIYFIIKTIASARVTNVESQIR